MEQAEQKIEEQLGKTEKTWALVQSLLQEILEVDVSSDTYYVAVPLMRGIEHSIKTVKDETNLLREDIKALREDLKAVQLVSKIPVPSTREFSIGQVRPREFEDDKERAARRQRTTSPVPHHVSVRGHDGVVSTLSLPPPHTASD